MSWYGQAEPGKRTGGGRKIIVIALILEVVIVVVLAVIARGGIGRKPVPVPDIPEPVLEEEAPAQPHTYSSADLEGVVSGIQDTAVILGSENIDLLSLITYDKDIVTGISLDTGLLNYARECRVPVTYAVTADKLALDSHLGIAGDSSEAGTVTLELKAKVTVLSEADAAAWQSSHPGALILTSDNQVYVPTAQEQPVEDEPEDPDGTGDTTSEPGTTTGRQTNPPTGTVTGGGSTSTPVTPNPNPTGGGGTTTPSVDPEPTGGGTTTPSVDPDPSGGGTDTPSVDPDPSGGGTDTPSVDPDPSGGGADTPSVDPDPSGGGTDTPSVDPDPSGGSDPGTGPDAPAE